MDHLYHLDAQNGDETSLVIDGEKVLGWIRTEGATWRLAPLDGGQTAREPAQGIMRVIDCGALMDGRDSRG